MADETIQLVPLGPHARLFIADAPEHIAATRIEAALQHKPDAVLCAATGASPLATYRELAATIALQGGDHAGALHQIDAITILEPDQAVHQTRRAALLWRMDRKEQARQAALKARQLDPDAPVQQFVQ